MTGKLVFQTGRAQMQTSFLENLAEPLKQDQNDKSSISSIIIALYIYE